MGQRPTQLRNCVSIAILATLWVGFSTAASVAQQEHIVWLSPKDQVSPPNYEDADTRYVWYFENVSNEPVYVKIRTRSAPCYPAIPHSPTPADTRDSLVLNCSFRQKGDWERKLEVFVADSNWNAFAEKHWLSAKGEVRLWVDEYVKLLSPVEVDLDTLMLREPFSVSWKVKNISDKPLKLVYQRTSPALNLEMEPPYELPPGEEGSISLNYSFMMQGAIMKQFNIKVLVDGKPLASNLVLRLRGIILPGE